MLAFTRFNSWYRLQIVKVIIINGVKKVLECTTFMMYILILFIPMNFKFILLVSCMLPLVPQEEQPTSDGAELYAQTRLALSLYMMALQQAV